MAEKKLTRPTKANFWSQTKTLLHFIDYRHVPSAEVPFTRLYAEREYGEQESLLIFESGIYSDMTINQVSVVPSSPIATGEFVQQQTAQVAAQHDLRLPSLLELTPVIIDCGAQMSLVRNRFAALEAAGKRPPVPLNVALQRVCKPLSLPPHH